MATTTPNFGWSVPTSTDLVKDGATAIETLGDSIDASFVGLKGGTTGQVLSKTSNTDLAYTWVAPTTGDITGVTAGTGISGGGTSGDVTVTNSMATAIDAKGDLIGGTGADAFARLAVGTNGQVLTADSAQSTGLSWTTLAAGGLTLLSTTSLSTTTTTISSISQSYKNLFIIARDVDTTTGNSAQLLIRFNGDTANNYFQVGVTWTGSSAAAYAGNGVSSIPGSGGNAQFGGQPTGFNLQLFRYTDTSRIQGIFNWNMDDSSGITYMGNNSFRYNASAAITSITVANASAQAMSGTVYIYGVN